MIDPSRWIRSVKGAPRVGVMTAVGYLDEATVDGLRNRILAAHERGYRTFILDFRAVYGAEPEGLSLLADFAELLRIGGHRIRIASARPDLRWQFERQDYGDLFSFHPSVPAALMSAVGLPLRKQG